MNGPLLVVVGPTATGKTTLAIDLAERVNGEIVSADSVQIYRHFDIGSGKPTADEQRRIRHHLVDCVDPLAPMDAQIFAERATAAIEEIHRRGRIAIVCGGTYLWVRALVEGLAPAPPSSPEIRAAHQVLAAKEGRGALHEQLLAVDPQAAARLAPNDFVRVSRALEVFALTGKPISEWHAEHGFRTTRYPHQLLGIDMPREELDLRIRARARAWLEAGWVDEVRALQTQGFGDARAMGSVGYKQVRDFLRNELPESELLDEIVRATRIFVRRQRTWLRERPVRWVKSAAELTEFAP